MRARPVGAPARAGTERARRVQRTIALALASALLCALAFVPASEAAPPELWTKCPTGSGAGQCVNPRNIASSPVDGHVFVADQVNARIKEFTAWGEFVKAWGWGVRDGSAEPQTCGPGVAPPSEGCQAGIAGDGPGQLKTGLNGVAVDAAGDVYVGDKNNVRIQKFDPEGNFVLMWGGEVNKTTTANVCTAPSGDTCGIGIEGAANGFFSNWPSGSYLDFGPSEQLYVGDKERVQVFDTGGNYVKSIPIPGETVQSLSVDGAGSLFVAYRNGALDSKPDPKKLDPSGAVLCTMEGVANPRAIATDADGNAYVFDQGSFEKKEIRKFDSACNELESFGRGEFTGSTAIAIGEAPCLSAGNVDVYVANSDESNSFVRAYGPVPDRADLCPPPSLAPTVEAQFAASTDSSGAIVKAKINPHFWPDTRYFVQYGTGKCSEGGCEATQPAPPGALLTKVAADVGVTTPEVFLSGLQPNTAYRYRFVAESGGGGPVSGEEKSFHTLPLASEGNPNCPNASFRSGASAKLPDCRAYELVSPLEKNGGDVSWPALSTSFAQASGDGLRMTFSSASAFAGAAAAQLTSQYLAERKEGGWSTRSISPPRSTLSFYQRGTETSFSLFKAFSEDLCSGWVLQESDLTLTPGAPPGVANLYRRENCGGEGYELLTAGAPPGFGLTDDSLYFPVTQGFSADGRVSIFRANASLEVADGGPRAPLVCSTSTEAETTSYQWYRNSVPIAAATEPTYTPTEADRGTALQCEVETADAQGASVSAGVTSLIEPAPSPSPPDPGVPLDSGFLPANPTISGTPKAGQILTCAPGTWKGSPSFAYEWLRNGAPIGGATSSEYTLQGEDKGAAIQCRTTATNAGGAAIADSAPVVIESDPPTASAPPTISGTAEVGQTLTCEPGSWANGPTFAYQWLRNGANIVGATASTRTLAAGDAGKAIQCRVTASNADGSAQASSDRVVIPVAPATTPPQLTSPGQVSGEAHVGNTLSCETGTWSGSPTFAFKWLRNGSSIGGAGEATYQLQAEDLRKTIQCQVTATNAGASVVSIVGSPAGARYVDPEPPLAKASTLGPYQLYAADGSGQQRLVSVLPDGAPVIANASVGTKLSGPHDFRRSSVHHAVSVDGSRVFWSSRELAGGGGAGPGRLYLRINPTEPQSEVSGGQCTEAARACTIAVSGSPDSRFVDANPQGSRVLFRTGGNGEVLQEAEIEEEAGHLLANSQPVAGGVKGVMGASEDATRVYFASSEVLSGAQQNSEGETAQAGKANLYLYEQGAGFVFIATLSDLDVFEPNGSGGIWSPVHVDPSARDSRVAPDGLHAAFTSTAELTGYDSTDQASGEPDAQVFVFDATANGGEGKLLCVSCNPSGARPSDGRLSKDTGGPKDLFAAAMIPGWNSQFLPSRLLSDDGARLFFNAYDSLVPGDNNGRADVYQWEAPGKGDCTEESSAFSEANGGCVSLISSGQSVLDSEVYDATPSGSDVFFATQSSLVPQDYGLVDVYDARVNGGLPGPTPQPASCEGEACQSPAGPPEQQTPASAAFQGPGNVREGARPRCRKGKVRRRGRCVNRKPQRHKRQRRANHERRAGR